MTSVLIVFYSRTGNTKKIAMEIASILNCDIEEIEDTTSRSGPLGWLRAGRDAGQRSLTKLNPIIRDPADYDLIIVGSPVWNGTISTPIRTYLTVQKDKIKSAAFWVSGYKTDNNAIVEMTQILNGKPVAILRLLGREEVQAEKYHEKLNEFISKIGEFITHSRES